MKTPWVLAIMPLSAISLLVSASEPDASTDERSSTTVTTTATHELSRDLGHETLALNDGWASADAGTTGGSIAAPDQIFVVATRAELIAALNDGKPLTTSPANPSAAPKIIYVSGTIDFNTDDEGRPLTCPDYYRGGYTQEAFLATYDPAVWGVAAPGGAMEGARVLSQQAQQARVRIRVGSNTTLVGLGSKGVLRGVWLDIRGSSTVNATNIIIRNLAFKDTYDCFPAWAPTDGARGSWNSLYDSMSLRNADHVWVDHNSFEDHDSADELLPNYLGVLFQIHDGELDITNASDLVTVSWNRFRHHDKVMLIGSSDSASADRGKLRVTLHHNLFDDIGQRAPRVRFGQVHLYNNFYKIENAPTYVYSWGIGIESALYAENNSFRVPEGVPINQLISRLNGAALFETGTVVKSCGARGPMDLVQAWNTANDPDLSSVASWTPTLFSDVDATREVPAAVSKGAGPFHCGGN